VERQLFFVVGGLQKRAEVSHVAFAETKVCGVSQDLVEATEDGELAPEGIAPKKKIEDRVFLVPARHVVRVGHGHLVHISQERRHQIIDRLVGGRGRAA